MHMCVFAMCRWLPVCIELALKQRFLCFCRVFVSCASRSGVFRLITVLCLVSGAPVIICISSNFSLGIKTRLFVSSGGEVRFCVPACSNCACALAANGNQKSRVVPSLWKQGAGVAGS